MTGSGDPVSWLMIEPGWRVIASDGAEVGRVDEVAGDENADIFDGLAVSHRTLGRVQYVPAEQVGRITEGVVHLTIAADQAERLGEYREPAPQEQIVPEKPTVEERLEGTIVHPHMRAERVNVWTKLAFWLRRLRGRH